MIKYFLFVNTSKQQPMIKYFLFVNTFETTANDQVLSVC